GRSRAARVSAGLLDLADGVSGPGVSGGGGRADQLGRQSRRLRRALRGRLAAGQSPVEVQGALRSSLASETLAPPGVSRTQLCSVTSFVRPAPDFRLVSTGGLKSARVRLHLFPAPLPALHAVNHRVTAGTFDPPSTLRTAHRNQICDS